MKKLKSIFKVIFSIFIIVAIIIGLISMLFTEKKEVDAITSDEIALYVIDKNLVVDYSMYSYLEACFENLIEGTKKEKFEELYNIYIEDYKEMYTQEEITAKLKEFSSDKAVCEFEKAYNAGSVYIIEYTLNNKVEYMFMQLVYSEMADYNFAIVK